MVKLTKTDHTVRKRNCQIICHSAISCDSTLRLSILRLFFTFICEKKASFMCEKMLNCAHVRPFQQPLMGSCQDMVRDITSLAFRLCRGPELRVSQAPRPTSRAIITIKPTIAPQLANFPLPLKHTKMID